MIPAIRRSQPALQGAGRVGGSIERWRVGRVGASIEPWRVGRVVRNLSEPSVIIEHMFEGMQVGSLAGETGRASVSSATQRFPASASAAEVSSLPLSWRETAPGPEMIAALAAVSLQS